MNPARGTRSAALASMILALIAVPALADRTEAPIDHATWVDHDGQPVREPKSRKISLYGYMFRQALVEPISHAFDVPDKLLWIASPLGVSRHQEAAEVNAFDEVPNSTWFTNRNHMRAVPVDRIRTGPFDGVMPEKPWTVSDLKKEGYNMGFHIHDAGGRKWLVKLDRTGNPQAGSGAGTVVSRLVWAAGYNIALYQSVTFRREDLRFETQVASARPGAKDDPPITDADLNGILDKAARSADGRYYASASLYLPGKPLGPVDLHGRRSDDPNDRYRHKNRRDLRALYVLYSWLNNWDMKDQQTLDTYGKASEGQDHVTHNLLDVDGSLGAAAEGAKPPDYGYEMRVDFPWTLRRLVTLGFIEEPWRRAPQETGIPSVGRFEAKEFRPNHWRPLEEVPPFRKLTDRDGYWGAKLVASFSDAQIRAALDAAHYEDPRAVEYLLPVLIARREKVARYWFGRVAPLDFFAVDGGTLRFRDLALDLGLTGPREYELEVDSSPAQAADRAGRHITSTEVRLPDGPKRLSLTLSVAGSGAKSVRVELERTKSGAWSISSVRHA